MRFFYLGLCLVGLLAAIVLRRQRRKARHTPLSPGKVALITGASSGIGEEISLLLAKKGLDLVLVSRTQVNLEKVADKCLELGAKNVSVMPTDMTDAKAVTQMVATLGKDLAGLKRQLSVVVLNAGKGSITPFDSADAERTVEIATEMMEVNYLANVRLMKLLAPLMASTNKGGDFLVMGSLGGVLPSALRSPYCAAKHALQGYCNAVRIELAPKNIRVVMANPSFVQTGFHDSVTTADGRPVKRKGVSHFQTAESCAKMAIQAVEDRDLEVVMGGFSGWIGYRARPWLPRLVDKVAGQKAMANVVLDDGDVGSEKQKSAEKNKEE